MLKAAKSRSKTDDPKKEKLKAKPKRFRASRPSESDTRRPTRPLSRPSGI